MWLGSSLDQRDLGVLVNNKLNMSKQCTAVAMKANQILGYISMDFTSRDKTMIILLFSELVRLHLCPALVPTIHKSCGKTGRQ